MSNKKTFIQEAFDKALSLEENQSIIFTFTDEREIESKRTAFYHEKRKHLTFNPQADSIQISRDGLRLILKKTSSTWMNTGIVINEESGEINPLKFEENQIEISSLHKEKEKEINLPTPPNFSKENFQNLLKTIAETEIRTIQSMLEDGLSEDEIYDFFDFQPI